MSKSRPDRGRSRASASPPPRRPGAAAVLRWPLLLLICGVVVYANSLSGPFVFDDPVAIERNPSIRHLSAIGQVLSPPRETPVAGRPVVNLSLALNYAMGGLDPTSYHLWNVAVHLTAALLLFAIVGRTLRRPVWEGLFAGRSAVVAFVAALLWMLHPLASEPVDYVTQRTESMMAVFLLLTLYAAIRGREREHGATWQGVAIAACALGMASKESMAVAPLLVMLYDRAFDFPSVTEALGKRWRLYAGLCATYVVLAALVWNGPRSTVGTSAGITPFLYLLNQFQMIAGYLRLSAWPGALVLDYGTPVPLAPGDVAGAAALVCLVGAASLVLWLRTPRVGFAAAWFWITLLPTSSVVPITSEVGAERRFYLPLMALVVLAVCTGAAATERFERRSGRPLTRTAAMVALLVAVALGARTMARNREYANPLDLWRATVERRPTGRARLAYALQLHEAGRHSDALAELRRAAQVYPAARFSLATELYELQRFDEAIANARQFIAAPPPNSTLEPAHLLVAQSLIGQGRLDDAITEYRGLIARAPGDATLNGSLADLLFEQRRFAEAIPAYQALLAGHPAIPTAMTKLGVSLQAVGRAADALEVFTQVVALDPNSASARRNLARAYLERGEMRLGEEQARAAVRLQPEDALAHDLLATALASQRKFDEATEQFQRLLELNPSDARARDGLARVRQLRGR